MLWAMRFSAGVIRDVGAIAEGAAAPEKMRAGECNELQGERFGPDMMAERETYGIHEHQRSSKQ